MLRPSSAPQCAPSPVSPRKEPGMQSRPTVVVLAAGKGSRFNGSAHKLEQSLGDLSVLDSTLRNAIESRLPVVVVVTQALAAGASRIVAARDVVVVPQALAALGMGHSIAAGVAARADAPGWLLLPGDMPMVKPATLLAVAAALGAAPGGLCAVPGPARPSGGLCGRAVLRTDDAQRRRRRAPHHRALSRHRRRRRRPGRAARPATPKPTWWPCVR